MTQEILNKANQLINEMGKIETALCQINGNFMDISQLPQDVVDDIRETLENNLKNKKQEFENL